MSEGTSASKNPCRLVPQLCSYFIAQKFTVQTVLDRLGGTSCGASSTQNTYLSIGPVHFLKLSVLYFDPGIKVRVYITYESAKVPSTHMHT